MNMDSLIITAIYTILLFWGVSVGIRQIWQCFYCPKLFLNPLFENRQATWIFIFHILIVSLDLFLFGPLSLYFKSPLWYWGGRVALLTCSLPLAVYFNRHTESFGVLIGRWVRIRNFFEIGLHIWVASMPANWFYYYILLWWLVAYRYLDVGPRRLLQSLYNTPEKLAKRPWAPLLTWLVITTIYVLSFLAVYYQKIIYAVLPAQGISMHQPEIFEYVLVIGFNVIIAFITWDMIKNYTGSPGINYKKKASSAGTSS